MDGTVSKANRFFMTSGVVYSNCTKTGWPSENNSDPDYGYEWQDFEYQKGMAWRHLRINAKIFKNVSDIATLQDCFKACVTNYVDHDDGPGGEFGNDDPLARYSPDAYCKSYSWNAVEKICSFHDVFVSDDKPVEWCWDSNYASGYYEASDLDY